MCCLREPRLSRLSRTLACDGGTDGQTNNDSEYRASRALCGKKTLIIYVCRVTPV